MVATLLIGWQQCGDVGVNQASSKRIYIDTVQMVQGGDNNGIYMNSSIYTLHRGGSSNYSGRHTIKNKDMLQSPWLRAR